MARSTFNLVITLAWVNLIHTPDEYLHPYHKMYISSLNLLDTACGMLNIDFAPGLWSVLTSDTPPDLSFFKNLPAPNSKTGKGRYAVYCVVLEKVGFPPRVYFGCSVNERNYTIRTSQYTTMKGGLPKMIRESNRLGFTRTHTGLFLTMDNPKMAQLNDMARIVILNFEDVFTRIFFGRTKNSPAFRHDLDMDSHMFEHGVPGLVYWSSAP
ncbi:hypothetical protein Q7P36_002506 [Cladosporium allicinum]